MKNWWAVIKQQPLAHSWQNIRPKSSAFQAVVKKRAYIRRLQPTIFDFWWFFFKLFILFLWNIHYLQYILFLCIFLRFRCLILELFWQCGTLFFILSIIVGVVVLRLLDLQLLCNQCLSPLKFPPSLKVTATI